MPALKTSDLKTKLFRGLSDASRLAILNGLRDGALTVSEVVERTGLSQSNVSNHLACLRCCGLVIREQQGRCVYYELADIQIAQLLDLADELLAEIAQNIDQCQNYNPPTARNTERHSPKLHVGGGELSPSSK